MVGQCVLLGSLTSLVFAPELFQPLLCVWNVPWSTRLPWVLRLWNGQFLCCSPVEYFVNYASGFPYRDSFGVGGLASTTPPSFSVA